ncbi:MAG TPA: DinB family protein [Bryobacteraceae bacterium]|nr:DinB family protein [Bryobacteraceae bacterium]
MNTQELIGELKASQEFFERSSRCLSEEDSGFRPGEGLYTVAQHISHSARTIDWFIEGASRPEGFDMDFERHIAEAKAVTSITAAREWIAKSYQNAIRFLESTSETELERPLPPGPIMGGLPLRSVVGAIVDHSAHHRGALTVYSRLVGKVPLMPYME